jgi:hypothetical protein
MIIYTYIESEMQFENGIPIGFPAYIVLCNMPFDRTFDSLEIIHYQYDINETYT